MTFQNITQRAPCIVVVCLLSLGSTGHAANTPSRFKTEHQAAAKLLADGQWSEAADAYRRIMEKGLDDSLAPNAQLGLARALLGAGEYENALTAYQTLEQIVRQQKEKDTLSGQQPENAWHYTIGRGMGRVYETQREFDKATKAYRQAAVALGDKATLADWRARAYADAARCLELAGRGAEAAELMKNHLAELDPPEMSGMRALQKATLVRLLKGHGQTDEADKLLAEIKSDPQLDDQQHAAAETLVKQRRSRIRENSDLPTPDLPKSYDFGYTIRTRKGPDYLAIESVGRYELRIALQEVGGGLLGENRYGWITGWYNLADDPFKTRNLSGLMYFPLIKPHHIGYMEKKDGQWKRIEYRRLRELNKTLDVALGLQKGPSRNQQGSVTFEVLEESPVRVRTRTRHDRWPFECIEYTSYPTGQVFVAAAFDLARCAIVYDLCHEYWTPEERERFHLYVNKTVDANIRSESHVFHNGWYGYKNWGIGLACYATYYENPRAEAILRSLESEFRTRAAPALELAGDGGGWGEGYYVNYWLYEWLFFCEVARWCEGVDYYAMVPTFFRNRAVASMFETYPGIGTYGTRRPIPLGDGGGRVFGGDRDKALSTRRILVNHFRDDPGHQAVHAFNESTPRSGVGTYAYKDFLWRDTTVGSADLSVFRFSHISPGPGYVHARSSWKKDATYFFFKCGDRFTSHQHLDVGHFLIYRHEELAGDGGHYDGFGSSHDVNCHLRSIAHNTILVHDPSETWPNVRGGRVTGNDGGQAHNWPHHNGAVTDAAAWKKDRRLYEIADIVAFEDCGTYIYVAGDCTRAYSPKKIDCFTRQIVFVRPGTFVIFDRVVSREPDFKKTWLLQAMKCPEESPIGLVITNGKGRLFVQTLLPRDPQVNLSNGQDLYSYGGNTYPPRRDTGPAPECRIEISPSEPARVDYFLHVLTATDATVDSVQGALLEETNSEIRVQAGKATISFDKSTVAESTEIAGHRRPLPDKIVEVVTDD